MKYFPEILWTISGFFAVLSGWNRWVEADVGAAPIPVLFGLVRTGSATSTLSIGAEHRLIKGIDAVSMWVGAAMNRYRHGQSGSHPACNNGNESRITHSK